MKFDFIIGNPPYQEETEGTSDNPIYNYFMDGAFSVADKVELISPARFLFNVGKTPKTWNEKMLQDPHFKVLDYEQDSGKIFANTDIKGGVAITYRDADEDFGAIGTFTHYDELNGIMQKVFNKKGFQSISDVIYLQNKFDLDVLYHDYPDYKKIIGSDGNEKRLTTKIFEQLSIFTPEKTSSSDVKILGLIKNKRFIRYIDRKYLLPCENLDCYKLILPKSNGTGTLGEILSTPIIAEPSVGYTQTYIGIGIFETEDEAEAALKYIKSKFARIMLGVLKITQDNNRGTWKYVPIQDFTSSSDINWEKSIPEIDQQLYAKYGLNNEEIAFIESHAKEMK